MDLVHESTAPLAWDHEQMPFQLPSDAVAWKVRRYSGKPGRPPAVYGDHGILHLGLDATVADLRQAVADAPGSYRLYPVSADGKELEPIACMEIARPKREPVEAEVIDPGDPTQIARDVLQLCTQMVASRDQHDELISKVLTTLVTTTATIQRSTAALLGAANTTIQVANGVETIERPEPAQLDTAAVAEQLAEAIAPVVPPDPSRSHPWFVELLKGPIGMGLMQFLQNYAAVIHAQHMAAQQAPATDAEPAPEPAPTTPRNAAAMSAEERELIEQAIRAAMSTQATTAPAPLDATQATHDAPSPRAPAPEEPPDRDARSDPASPRGDYAPEQD